MEAGAEDRVRQSQDKKHLEPQELGDRGGGSPRASEGAGPTETSSLQAVRGEMSVV